MKRTLEEISEPDTSTTTSVLDTGFIYDQVAWRQELSELRQQLLTQQSLYYDRLEERLDTLEQLLRVMATRQVYCATREEEEEDRRRVYYYRRGGKD